MYMFKGGFQFFLNKWNDEKNRCSLTLIKSDIQIALNFYHNCQKFNDSINGDFMLLKTANSEEKY